MKWSYKKVPGFCKDLISVFSIYYNRSKMDSFCYIPAKKLQDQAFMDDVFNTFSPFPKELYPFFYMIEGQTCFLTTMYLYQQEDMKAVTTAQMLAWMDDETMMKQNMLDYYFGGRNDASTITLPEISRLINKSDYPDDLKHQLLALFVSPSEYIKAYQKEMAIKERQMKRYYEEHEDELQRAQEQFDENAAEMFFSDKELCPFAVDFKKLQRVGQIYYTIELINLNDLSVFANSELLMVGQHYREAAAELRSRAKAPDMVLFGKALAEANRVQILDLLLERGEMTRAQISAEMNISENLIYYHLAMLSAASVISSYNQKRTMFYYLNGEQFERVRQALTKYIPS